PEAPAKEQREPPLRQSSTCHEGVGTSRSFARASGLYVFWKKRHDWRKRMARLQVFFTLVGLLTCSAANAQPTLQLLPGSIELRGSEDSQRVIAVRSDNCQSTGQVAVEVKSSDPAIVDIRGTTLVPKGNGQATITATHEGQTATATVKVTGVGEPHA